MNPQQTTPMGSRLASRDSETSVRTIARKAGGTTATRSRVLAGCAPTSIPGRLTQGAGIWDADDARDPSLAEAWARRSDDDDDDDSDDDELFFDDDDDDDDEYVDDEFFEDEDDLKDDDETDDEDEDL